MQRSLSLSPVAHPDGKGLPALPCTASAAQGRRLVWVLGAEEESLSEMQHRELTQCRLGLLWPRSVHVSLADSQGARPRPEA